MIGKGESGATRKFTAILCRKQEEGNVSMSITPAYKLSSLVQTFHTIALQVFLRDLVGVVQVREQWKIVQW